MIKFYHESDFDDEQKLTSILGLAPNEEDLLKPKKSSSVLYCFKPFNLEQEVHFFRKLNCLKFLAFMADKEEEKADRLAHASCVRNIILKHNLRLVTCVLKKYKDKELFNEASLWMLDKIIDDYDYRITSPFAHFLRFSLAQNVWHHLRKLRRDKLVATENMDSFQIKEKISLNTEEEFEKIKEYISIAITDKMTKDILFRKLGLEGSSETFVSIAETYNVNYQSIQKRFDSAMIKLFGRTINNHITRELQKRV